MIFRKPYAFLIKNFKKIHIVLMILCAYIFYKHLQVYHFVKEYVDLESYSVFLEPIGTYTNFLVYFSIVLVIVIAILLAITLRRKKKPWKLYLVIIGEYFLMLFAFMMTTSFFANYSDTTAVTQILVVRDLLLLASFAQYLVFIILFIRITGLDLNKFNFATDQEFLELDSTDREEVEVNIEFDKHAIHRTYRKLKRNISYFYLEHKLLIRSILAIVLISLIGYSYYYFGIYHKAYREGQTLNASNYEITVNHAYLTDKDYKGDLIDGDHYIILDLKVKNNGPKRVMNTDRFHLMNHSYDILSSNLYDTDFIDLGTPYTKREFQSGKTYNFLLIFRADSRLDIHKFNLYYQEYISANETYLRKIRLNIEDLRTIENMPEVSLGQEQEIEITNQKKKITLDTATIGDVFSYNYYKCEVNSCYNEKEEVVKNEGKKILKIDFTSLDFTGEEFIDFSTDYGKIKYKDSTKKTQEIDIKSAVARKVLNKSIYLEVPEEVAVSNQISFELTVRNHKYTFKLR